MASITDLLSQYGVLSMLCSSLSSADIIHLAETSKAHWTYIASNDNIRKLLIQSGICDGSGVIARARCFLNWGGDEAIAKSLCLEKDAEPCTDCGALVCNNCRFRFLYHVPLDEFGEQEERDYAFQIWQDFLPEELEDPADKRATNFYHCRDRAVCHDCHPLLDINNPAASKCDCEMYDHFVGRRRLCMPCFFVEETKVIKADTARMEHSWSSYSNTGCADQHCNCGKEASGWETYVCVDCGRFSNFQYHRDGDKLFDKILAQLGGSRERPKYDAELLAQLG